MTTRRGAPVDELADELERREASRMRSPYARQAVEWLGVLLIGGLVLSILGIASALVYWAWTA